MTYARIMALPFARSLSGLMLLSIDRGLKKENAPTPTITNAERLRVFRLMTQPPAQPGNAHFRFTYPTKRRMPWENTR